MRKISLSVKSSGTIIYPFLGRFVSEALVGPPLVLRQGRWTPQRASSSSTGGGHPVAALLLRDVFARLLPVLPHQDTPETNQRRAPRSSRSHARERRRQSSLPNGGDDQDSKSSRRSKFEAEGRDRSQRDHPEVSDRPDFAAASLR